MSLPVTSAPTAGGTTSGAQAPRDLRAWIDAIERIGQLKRIPNEVSRNEEMGAITYLAHRRSTPPPFSSRTSRSRPAATGRCGTRSAPASTASRWPLASRPASA